MRHTVSWLPAAEQELANIWLAAEDRAAISQAAALLDRQLQNDPDAIGESRPDGRRIHFAAPLGILFKIYSNGLRVVVTHVWSFGSG
jgi:hypothetical protein